MGCAGGVLLGIRAGEDAPVHDVVRCRIIFSQGRCSPQCSASVALGVNGSLLSIMLTPAVITKQLDGVIPTTNRKLPCPATQLPTNARRVGWMIDHATFSPRPRTGKPAASTTWKSTQGSVRQVTTRQASTRERWHRTLTSHGKKNCLNSTQEEHAGPPTPNQRSCHARRSRMQQRQHRGSSAHSCKLQGTCLLCVSALTHDACLRRCSATNRSRQVAVTLPLATAKLCVANACTLLQGLAGPRRDPRDTVWTEWVLTVKSRGSQMHENELF